MTEIGRAVVALRAGELVAFPTETVYGLGADATNPAAVARIFAAKGRPADHPLIVHLPDVSHLSRWAIDIPEVAYRVAAAFWPGPLTLILKRHPGVLDAITGGQDTVGLRVPSHPLALQLLQAFDGGIAAPSANRFGHVSPTTAAHVRQEFGDDVAVVLDGGPCAVGIESTILDLSDGVPRILRPGMLGAAALGAVLGVEPGYGGNNAPRVSGSLEAHYSPHTPLRLVSALALPAELRAALEAGLRTGVLAAGPAAMDHPNVVWHQAGESPESYAHELYAVLRRFDAAGLDQILVAAPPDGEAWRAVADRLGRAAAGAK